ALYYFTATATCHFHTLSLHDALPISLDDPRGNLVQHEFPGAGVHRVTGVRPALIAHDQIGALGEHVDNLPFALVERADLVVRYRSEEHTSELQSRSDLVCRLLLEKKK